MKYKYFDWFGCPVRSKEVIKLAQDFENIPTTSRSNFFLDIEQELKIQLVKRFNLKPNQKIVFGFNASDLSNKLQLFLNKNNFTIQTTNYEHHSNYASWLKNNSNVSLKQKIEDFTQSDLYLTTLVSNITGEHHENQIIELRKRYSTSLLIVDGSQSVNYDVDIQKLDCDFFYFSSHKYGAFHGLGVGIITDKLYNLLHDTSFIGGGNVLLATQDKVIIHDENAHFWVGTKNNLAIRSLSYCLQNKNIIDTKLKAKIVQFDLEMQTMFKKISVDNYFCCTYMLPNFLPGHDLSEELAKKNFIIRTGNLCCSALADHLESDFFRISFGYKNKITEVTSLLSEIKKIYNFYKQYD